MEVTLVTGNKNKLVEISNILTTIILKSKNIDLEEIQSMDLREIVEHKAKLAFKELKMPILVEDTGFFLEELNGLPGPFLKFFEKRLGNNALVKLLNSSENRTGYAKVCMGFYDGENLVFGEGILKGKVIDVPSENEGFGFDVCFIPEGYKKTISELGIEVKNSISHRKLACLDLIKNLKKIGRI